MNDHAKDIYLRIMQMIQIKEARLRENQDMKVTLLQYPDFEVTEIGRLGNEYLFFSGMTSQSPETTLLLPVESIPIRIDVVDQKDELPVKAVKKIGFRGDISSNK
ncbi:hypothetical protein [Acetonema longum]|uniref:Uncharacterized protein n=1 Tax=Acetonema longum DSM 6540 TaxID=1009370 RepID=F7NDU8_9FIRM|nr:hypothetical protein [Acetonema longum]EGO65763.1 hypothetical protein ALO_01025 [Acetonema longum DSM 6540]